MKANHFAVKFFAESLSKFAQEKAVVQDDRSYL